MTSDIYKSLTCARINDDWFRGMSAEEQARTQSCQSSVSVARVRRLLSKGYIVDEALEDLLNAAEKGNISKARKLLDAGVGVNWTWCENNAPSALDLAAQNDELEMVRISVIARCAESHGFDSMAEAFCDHGPTETSQQGGH